jgi:NADH-quinone oxidoreductase subunit N
MIMSETLLADLGTSLPLIVLSLGALVIMLLEVFVKGSWARETVTVGFLLVALVALLRTTGDYSPGKFLFNGLVYADPLALFFTALLIAGTILAVLVGARRLEGEGVESHGEYLTLLILSTVGAIIFASSAELITMFLGLETMSMALYCLCGAALGRRRSAESAMKYFLLGSFSSAFLLYGISLVYGLTGTTMIAGIAGLAEGISPTDQSILFVALGLILVGLIFKIGAVPFHFWAPDVYEGAPTPIAAYMACVIKASAVAAALRVLWGAFGGEILFWADAIWVIAVLTMVIGNLIALRQRGLKRMLAYSSIAHAGYLLVAFLAHGPELGGGAAILYYLIGYTCMTMGAFAIVLAVTGQTSGDPNGDDISRFHGLGYKRPVLALVMSLFMLSLAGIPPGMAGLLGKVYIFTAAVKAQYLGLTIIGVLASAVSCYYYLRVIVAMYFVEAKEEGEARLPAAPLSGAMVGALGICAFGVIYFGVFPSALYEFALRICQTL